VAEPTGGAAVPVAPEPDLAIADLIDAMQLTIGLHDRFGRFHASAALAVDGTVVDLAVFAGRHHDVFSALDYAAEFAASSPGCYAFVLTSSTDHDQQQVREVDIELFRRVRSIFASAGIEVIDWVITDGETLRSMACTCGVSWGDPRWLGP